MAAKPPPAPTTDDEALLQALRAVLQPLAKLAVARGMTYAPVDEIVRQVFVQAADEAHPELLPHRKVSHVATVTGLHRREVTRLVQALRDGSAKDGARPRSLVNELYTHWLSDPAYRDRKGAPRVLPRQGPAPSFESLAHAITRNVHPRTLLDELLRLGLVQLDADKDRVSAVREAIVPRGDVQRMLGYLGANVGDHLAGAAANVQADGGRHFEQAVSARGLSPDSIAEARGLIRNQWKTLLSTMVPALETMVARDAGRPDAQQRLRVGLYSFDEGHAPQTAAAALPAAAPKPRRKRST
jgi:Family of unknown function (DUF6502)